MGQLWDPFPAEGQGEAQLEGMVHRLMEGMWTVPMSSLDWTRVWTARQGRIWTKGLAEDQWQVCSLPSTTRRKAKNPAILIIISQGVDNTIRPHGHIADAVPFIGNEPLLMHHGLTIQFQTKNATGPEARHQ